MWIGVANVSPPLYESTFKDKTGISEVRNGITLEWARALEIDLEKIKAYAEAVHAATDEFLEGLGDDHLDRMIDMSVIGAGEQSLGWVLGTLLINHISWMTGENFLSERAAGSDWLSILACKRQFNPPYAHF